MKLRPINDRIIVRRSVSSAQEGSFIVPEQYKKVENKGEILAVGEGLMLPNGKRVAPSVRVGDVVHFQPKVMEVTIEKETYIVLTENDILFVEGGSPVNVSEEKADTKTV